MTRRIVLFSLVAISLVLGISSCSSEKGPGRVIVLALDGVDPHTVDLLLSEGKLPNFARLKTEGAYSPLLSQKPLLSPVVWTTVATGKTPDVHRIGHFVAVNPVNGEQLPVTSQMRKTRALWNILSENDRSVGTAGWWATWPAETVKGTVVSDHVAFHFLFDEGLKDAKEQVGLTYPAEVSEEIKPLIVRPTDIGWEVVSKYLSIDKSELDKKIDFDDPVSHFRWAFAASETYKNIGLHLWRTRKPDNLFVYIEAVDSTSHLFGHVFRTQHLAGELAAQQKRYGNAVEQIYIRADEIVGQFIDAMDDRTTLIVLSDHGFELGAVPDDPSMTRDFRRVSEKFHRLRGVLFMYGNKVKRGDIDRPSILDIAPTVLALNGVPAGRDMKGRELIEALDVPELPRVDSWDGEVKQQEVASEPSPVDQEVLEKLKSLGYLGTTSPNSDVSLAGVLFEQGRYEEAAAAYEKLIESDPQSAFLRSSYAAALGALGRYDEALRQIDVSIELQPLNAEAYHNRGVVLEHKGDRDGAIKAYRTALKYKDFEPSKGALAALGVSPSDAGPVTAAQKQATELAQKAEVAAKRGDYAGAVRFLDEAEKIAPDVVLVYQYRSNVAYLMGDVDGAIRALERGLELDPDNALFRQNLENLKAVKNKKQ